MRKKNISMLLKLSLIVLFAGSTVQQSFASDKGDDQSPSKFWGWGKIFVNCIKLGSAGMTCLATHNIAQDSREIHRLRELDEQYEREKGNKKSRIEELNQSIKWWKGAGKVSTSIFCLTAVGMRDYPTLVATPLVFVFASVPYSRQSIRTAVEIAKSFSSQ